MSKERIDRAKSKEKLDSQLILLEEYKLYVEMADRVSHRRQQANQFYVGLLAGILAILSFVAEQGSLETLNHPIVFLTVAILGLILCFVWNLNINSYRQLNSGKFNVIHELEEYLPYPLYKREWEILGEGQNAKKYLQLTRVEKWIPLIISIPYLILFIYGILTLTW